MEPLITAEDDPSETVTIAEPVVLEAEQPFEPTTETRLYVVVVLGDTTILLALTYELTVN